MPTVRDQPRPDAPLPPVVPSDLLRDPRESEDWFLRLPRDVQERMRGRWRTRRALETTSQANARCRALRSAREGAALLAFTTLLTRMWVSEFGPMLLEVGLGGVAGAGAGVFIEKTRAGRFGSAAAGVVAYGFTAATGSLTRNALAAVLFFGGAWLVACLFAAYGLHREFRGLDGSEGAENATAD